MFSNKWAYQSIFTATPWWKAGSFMTINGVFASAASYAIGYFVGIIVEGM
jgi:hypothetical protein